MNRERLQRIFLVCLGILSLFLFVDLLFLNGILLTWMRVQLAAAYFGKANLLIGFLFKRVAAHASRTPLPLYQEKLTNLYQEIKIPLLLLVIGLTAYFWLSSRPAGAVLAIRDRFQRLGFLLFFCLLVPIFAHAYIGSYSRFLADDYCTAGAANAKGVLGATTYWYVAWDGVYSANFLHSLTGVAGPRLTPFDVPIALFIWFAAMVFALYQFPSVPSRLTRFCLSALLAAALLFSILELSPSVTQSLYWGQGMQSYLPPLILAAVCVGLLGYGSTHPQSLKRSILWGLLAGGIVFIAGGFDETYVALQTSALAVALLVGFALGSADFKRKFLPQATICFLGSLASLAVVFFAPGNKVRQTHFHHLPGLTTLLKIAVGSTIDFLSPQWALWDRNLSLLALLVLSGLVAGGFFSGGAGFNWSMRQTKRALVWLPVASLVLLAACFAPSAYGLNSNPPGRTYILPFSVLVCLIAAWGALLGAWVRQRTLPFPEKRVGFIGMTVAVGTLILYLVITPLAAYTVVLQEPVFARYASVWDAGDQQIRVAKSEGLDHVQIQFLRNWAGLDDITENEKSWVNICASQYYGITITGKDIDTQ